MGNDPATSSSNREQLCDSTEEAGRRATPLPFDPVGKTHYTAEEIHALFEGAPPPGDDNNRTVLAAHPDRPATPEELMAFVDEMQSDTPAVGEAGTPQAASVPVRFGRGELNAFVNEGARPPTPDERTRLAEHPDRPATADELRELADGLWALYRAEEDAG